MKENNEPLTNEASEQNRPFFARFLEGQDTTKLSAMTLKYPSDRDEIEQVLDYTSGNNNN